MDVRNESAILTITQPIDQRGYGPIGAPFTADPIGSTNE